MVSRSGARGSRDRRGWTPTSARASSSWLKIPESHHAHHSNVSGRACRKSLVFIYASSSALLNCALCSISGIIMSLRTCSRRVGATLRSQTLQSTRRWYASAATQASNLPADKLNAIEVCLSTHLCCDYMLTCTRKRHRYEHPILPPIPKPPVL